ncbi:MAG: type 1 glutamine amidotransferase [Thermodesulfovibrionales bacterium]|nr:type 1 glutamine amidotransferase [Thermodesulfovibrionales bacterium]
MGMIIDIFILMSVLILKNIETEGPGTIQDFLRENNIAYKIVELADEEIRDTEKFDALIMMGGPMSVNESDAYTYISREEELTREFIKKGKKVLGVCLGAQILAKALGAKVYKGKEPEIGWHDIELTEAGIKDNLMKKLALHPKAGDFWKKFSVFHWHGETFDIPEGAVRLAKSDLYPNQAFKYNENAYAFQFHIEVTKEMVYDWLSAPGGSACGGKNEPIDQNELKAETEKLYEIYYGRALNFYKAFFK